MRATYSLIPVGRYYYYYYGVCMSRAAVAGSIGRLLFFEAGKAKFASPPSKLMDEILMLKIRGIFYSSNRYLCTYIV